MYVVIGGSGFIGTRLCERLNKKNDSNFTIIDKVPSKTFPGKCMIGDVRSVDALGTGISGGSVIINLAAEHSDNVRPISLYDEVNVNGARNICTVAREKNIKIIIFTSTVAVYGFSPVDTDESGEISPFNDYGRSKYEAEQVFKEWQAEVPEERVLVIVRPVPVTGEKNRSNVYYLLRQIYMNRFIMVGKGINRKSITYVENLAAFLEYSITFKPGLHIYNYVDKPDLTMNNLVITVKRILGKPEKIGIRLPYAVAYMLGKVFDLIAAITGKRFALSSIRVKKFATNSVFISSIDHTGFVPPVSLAEGLERTVRYEFLESH